MEIYKPTILYTPLNASGHINGASGLIDRIVQLTNCRVVVLTVGKIQSSRITSKNYEFINIDASLNEHLNEFEDEYEWPQSKILEKIVELVNVSRTLSPVEHCSVIMRLMSGSAKREAVCLDAEFSKIIKQVNPDLIITDYLIPPPAILHQSEIPWVYFISCNPLGLTRPNLKNGIYPLMFTGSKLFDKETRLNMQKSNPKQWQDLLDGWDKDRKKLFELYPPSASVYNKYVKTIGLPETVIDYLPHMSPYMNVYMYPKCLDYGIQDDDILSMPDAWTNCEIALQKSNLSEDTECSKYWLEEIQKLRCKSEANKLKPLIYFSLGSLACADINLMKRYLQILSEDEKNLYIVSKGVHGDSLDLNGSSMIGANFLPQIFLLKQVDLAIVHGGNNTILECLYVGIPLIVLPVFTDQTDNAQRLEDLKLGFRLDIFTTDSRKLLSTVDQILSNEDLKLRIKQISENLQNSNECDKVAQRIANTILKK